MQLVTGRDGNKYQVVIDPKTGLQTFIPYREPAQRSTPRMQKMPFQIPQGPMGNPEDAIQNLPFRMQQGMGQGAMGQGGQTAPGALQNRLRNMLSA